MKTFIEVIRILFILLITVSIFIFSIYKVLDFLSKSNRAIKIFSSIGEFSIKIYIIVTFIAFISLIVYFAFHKKNK